MTTKVHTLIDDFSWHYRKWLGLGEAQSRAAASFQFWLMASISLIALPLPTGWRVIGWMLLVGAVWWAIRLIALLTWKRTAQ